MRPAHLRSNLIFCAIVAAGTASIGAWSGIVTDKPSTSRRHLALFFPYLPADRLRWEARLWRLEGRTALDSGPYVFVEKVKGALRLAAVDRRAEALGLIPSLNLADARARVPELMVFDHEPAADQRLLERIADQCERYTPMIALDGLDGLLLDITGCAHLFGGESGLVADVEQRFARIGFGLRTALAASPEAAHALARFQNVPAVDAQAAVRRLPVAALECDAESEIALRRAGLKTIADLADRPPAMLAARFGREMVDRLARLIGRSDSRISPRRPLPALSVERRFAEPLTRSEAALAVLGELVTEAAGELERRAQGGRQFQARFFRSDGLCADLAVETGLPTRDPAVVTRLFRERVEALADPIDPGFGFDLIRLGVSRLETVGAQQLRLEGGVVADAELAQLVDRLSNRLGRGRVRRFVARDTHLPEQAALALPAIEVGTPAPWEGPVEGEPPLRPIHLFDPPQPIEVVADVPDGPPRRFRWRRRLHDVARFEGPERIAPAWWRLAPDESGLTRDYYRIEDVRGRRYWIFRHGLFGSERSHPGWYMHGLFA